MNDEKNNLTVLTILYENLSNEITRYRDYEWQVTVLVGGLLLWVITNLKVSCLWIKLLWVFLISIIWAFAIWALCYFHTRLRHMRNVRRKIEHILLIYEPKWYLPDAFSIPEGWDKTDFDLIYEKRRGQKIPGFIEGKGILFVVAFMCFLTVLAFYAAGIVWGWVGLCFLAIFILATGPLGVIACFVLRDREVKL